MSVSEKDARNRSAPKKRGRKAVKFLAVIILLFAGWRVWASHRVNVKLAALRAAGYPTSLAELEQKYYPKITTGENGADYYLKIFAEMTNIVGGPSWPTNREWGLVGDFVESMSSEEIERLSQLLSTHSNWLNLLRSAPGGRKYRYPVNLEEGYKALTPHIHRMNLSSRLLLGEAGLKCQDGQTEEAIADIDAVFRLSQSLSDEPVLFSQLNRFTLNNRAISAVGNVISHGQLTDSQLVRIGNMCQSNRPTGAIERGLVGELCNGIQYFQMTIVQKAGSVLFFDDGKNSNLDRKFFCGIWSVSGLNSTDFNFFLDSTSEHLRMASVPFPQKLDAAEILSAQFNRRSIPFSHLFSSLYLPELERAYQAEAATLGKLDLAQTAIAIERFRLVNGNRLPEKLDELVPTYLEVVPMDPFDGKPLRYKKLAKGYMVYSIGPDRKDDGGVTRDFKKGQMADDIVFEVMR